MRKIVALFLFVIGLAGVATPCVGAEQQNDGNVAEDSILNVIGWFYNHDALEYWIEQSDWKVTPNDTVQTSGISTKVRVEVTDSTASGFKMKFSFLEMKADTLESGPKGDFQKILVDEMAKAMVGTTVNFETNEYGEITKINNSGEIKKKAKSMFKNSMKNLGDLPFMKEAKKNGFDINDIIKGIDTDVLVEGFLEDLNLLFLYHGTVHPLGEFSEHEDATEDQFENESAKLVRKDENGRYHIETEVVSIIPKEDVKSVMYALADGLYADDSVKNEFKDNADITIFDDGMIDSYLGIDYMPEGWPYRVLKQESTMVGERGKLKQKNIFLSSYSAFEQ